MDAKMAFKNYSSLSDIFSKLKDPIKKEERKDVVYLVKCIDCTNRCYIGTTGVYIQRRMNQHGKDVSNKDEKRSALAFHALQNHHKFDLDNPIILEQHNHQWKREYLEELHIRHNETCVNIRSRDSGNVSTIYTHLLRRYNSLTNN